MTKYRIVAHIEELDNEAWKPVQDTEFQLASDVVLYELQHLLWRFKVKDADTNRIMKRLDNDRE